MTGVRNAFGSIEAAQASASEQVRRWDTALIWGPVAGVAVFAGVGTTLWHMGAPALSLLAAVRQLGECVLWLATAGHAHQQAVSGLVHAPGVLVRLGLSSLAAGVTAARVMRSALVPRSRERHIDGIRLLEGKEAVTAARTQAKAGGEGFLHLHPDYYAAKTQITRHILIFGSIGGGKTQIILPMLEELMGIGRHGRKAFIYDVKADYTSHFDQAALINPYDRRSYYWDISADITTAAGASTLASSLIPTKDGDFWSQSAQQVLIGVLRFLISEKTHNGRKWGWKTLADVLASDVHTLKSVLVAHYPQAARLLADPESNSALDLMKTLAAHTRVIDDLAQAWGNGLGMRHLSLTAWARDDYTGRRQIIAQATPDKVLTSSYISAMVNTLVPVIISPALPDNELGRSLFFVLDELPSLGKIELAPLLDKGRSKGVSCILGLQDISQVKEIYGNNFTTALQSMVGTTIICRLNLGETRETVSGFLGKRRVATTSNSQSAGSPGVSSAQHEEMRAVVPASQLTTSLGVRRGKQWPNGFAVRAILSTGSDLLLLDWPGVVLPKKRAGFVPAKWTTTLPKPRPVAVDTRLPPPDPPEPVAVEESERGNTMKIEGGLDQLKARRKKPEQER
jgi:hypothetical protein